MPRRLSYTEKSLDDLDAARHWLTQPGSGPAAGRKLAASGPTSGGFSRRPANGPLAACTVVRALAAAGGWRVLSRK